MPDHLDLEILVAWWLDELEAAEANRVEDHLFVCARCTERLGWLVALSDGVSAAVRAGALGMVVSAAFVETMKQAGLRLREYRLGPGDRVNCTIAADDDAVVSRVQAPLGGVNRVDAFWRVQLGGVEQPEVHLEDVPFDPGTGEIVFLPPPAALRKLPAHTQRLRLTGIGPAGESMLGEYTFHHTPS